MLSSSTPPRTSAITAWMRLLDPGSPPVTLTEFHHGIDPLGVQVTTVGIPSQIFRPGVLVPEVIHRGVAERSGLRTGDLVTAVAGRRLQASPNAVNELVEVIK